MDTLVPYTARCRSVGQAIAVREGDRWMSRPEAEWLELFRARAVELMVAEIKRDLLALGIRFDVFSSERALVEVGAVQRALDTLQARGLVYTGVLEPPKGTTPERSEEHTSELQSLMRISYAGFC